MRSIQGWGSPVSTGVLEPKYTEKHRSPSRDRRVGHDTNKGLISLRLLETQGGPMQRRRLARFGWPSKHGSPRTLQSLESMGNLELMGAVIRIRAGSPRKHRRPGDHQRWGGTATTAILEPKKHLENLEGLVRM